MQGKLREIWTRTKIILFVSIMCSGLYSLPSYANPVDSLVVELPGSQSWWKTPGIKNLHESEERTDLTIKWLDANLARYKIDEDLRYLLTSKGPIYELNFNRGYTSLCLSVLNNELDSFLYSRGLGNDLRGSRILGDINFSKCVEKYDGKRLIITGKYSLHRLSTNGHLPAFVNGIPGFENEETSGLKWVENEWFLGAYILKDKKSIGACLSLHDDSIIVESMSPSESINLAFIPQGYSFAIFGRSGVSKNLMFESYCKLDHSSSDRGVYRKKVKLGPLGLKNNAWQLGFKIYENTNSPDWHLSLTHSNSGTSINGSADLTGFNSPVFGVVSPRVHMDSDLSVLRTTLLSARSLNWLKHTDLTGYLGMTHWKTKGWIKTWESVLFGSGILNESTTWLDITSGWLLHLGFSKSWELTESDQLGLVIGQTVPFHTNNRGITDTGIAGPARDKTWDGGRYFAVSYTHTF